MLKYKRNTIIEFEWMKEYQLEHVNIRINKLVVTKMIQGK